MGKLNIFNKYGAYADYTNIIEFSMRESAFTIDSLIDETFKAGVLLLDSDHLLEILKKIYYSF